MGLIFRQSRYMGAHTDTPWCAPFSPFSNNLLYPEVDRSNHVLLYSCRNCSHKEEARSNMVFKNDLKSVTKVSSRKIGWEKESRQIGKAGS